MDRRRFLLMSASAIASCAHAPVKPEGYAVLDRHDEPLRSAFNRASAAVRVVMLVSPT